MTVCSFQSPTLLLPYLDNFMCFTGNGMIEAMLEPHLKREAGATQFDVAMTFLILGGCYMLTTPIWGYVSPTVPLCCSTFNFDQCSWTNNSLIIIFLKLGMHLYKEKCFIAKMPTVFLSTVSFNSRCPTGSCPSLSSSPSSATSSPPSASSSWARCPSCP